MHNLYTCFVYLKIQFHWNWTECYRFIRPLKMKSAFFIRTTTWTCLNHLMSSVYSCAAWYAVSKFRWHVLFLSSSRSLSPYFVILNVLYLFNTHAFFTRMVVIPYTLQLTLQLTLARLFVQYDGHLKGSVIITQLNFDFVFDSEVDINCHFQGRNWNYCGGLLCFEW